MATLSGAERIASHYANAVPMTMEQVGGEHAEVMAFPLVGKHAVVRTTHREVRQGVAAHTATLREYGRPYLEGLYQHIYRIAMAYKMEMNDDTDAKKRAWQDFCNDVVILYTMRHVLTGKPIHITSHRSPVTGSC